MKSKLDGKHLERFLAKFLQNFGYFHEANDAVCMNEA